MSLARSIVGVLTGLACILVCVAGDGSGAAAPAKTTSVRPGDDPARTASPSSSASARGPANAGRGPTEPAVRLFHIKFRDPNDVARLVGDLLSVRGSVTTQPKLRTVIVQDSPGIIDRIEQLIASYDVPPRSVEFTVTLILATLSEDGREGERQSISSEVRGIAEALPDITRWTNYKTLDSVTIAGSEGSKTARDLADAYRVEFSLESVSEPRGIIRLNPFSLQKAERDAAGLVTYRSVYTTTVNLKNDKLLTIGATKSETSPRALFLAIRARIDEP